jgi:phage baseplate assembly protein W
LDFRQKTYGIIFPFHDSTNGDYVQLTTYPELEIKSNLIHLLLTRKGSRYFLPDFGTNLYQYIFEPLSDTVLSAIQNEIKTACAKYLPNLQINAVNITQYNSDPTYANDMEKQHQITVKIDYTINSRTFQVSDDITINF